MSSGMSMLRQRASTQRTCMDQRQPTLLHIGVEACGAAAEQSEPRASSLTIFVVMPCFEAEMTFKGHSGHGPRRGTRTCKRQCWTLPKLWMDSGQLMTLSGMQAAKPKGT